MLTHKFALQQLRTARPTKTAVYCGDIALTFTELDEITARLADGLAGRGLEPGDRVAWLGRNSLEYFLLYFATAKTGLVIAPLNYWWRSTELAGALDRVTPRLVIAQEQFRAALADTAATARHAPEQTVFVANGSGAEPPEVTLATLLGGVGTAILGRGDDEYAPHEIIFTSGTTGPAKAVIRSQRKRVLDSYLSASAFEFTHRDHMRHLGPQFHTGGMAMANQVLFVGGAVSIGEFSPESVRHSIDRGATFLAGVPTHFAMLAEEGSLTGYPGSLNVTGLKLAGSATTPRTYELAQEMFPNARISNGWGMTESGPHTIAVRGQDLIGRPGTIGTCVPGNAVRIVDDEGREVAGGDGGELQVLSLTTMDGYFGEPERTAATFDGPWMRTGDRGYRDGEGFYFLTGRASDMIITGGENVHPAEVEKVLGTMPGVADAIVLGVPDELFGERIVAVVHPEQGATPTAAEVIAYASARLAGFKTPGSVRFAAGFPRTASGKVARHVVRAALLADADSDADLDLVEEQ